MKQLLGIQIDPLEVQEIKIRASRVNLYMFCAGLLALAIWDLLR